MLLRIEEQFSDCVEFVESFVPMLQSTEFLQFLLYVALCFPSTSTRSLYDENVPRNVVIHSAKLLLAGNDTRLGRRMQDVEMSPLPRIESPPDSPQSPRIPAIHLGGSSGAELRAGLPQSGTPQPGRPQSGPPRVGSPRPGPPRAELIRPGPPRASIPRPGYRRPWSWTGAPAEVRTGSLAGVEAEPDRRHATEPPPYRPVAAAQMIEAPQRTEAARQAEAASRPAEEARARTMCAAYLRLGARVREQHCTREQKGRIISGCCTLGVGLCMLGTGVGLAAHSPDNLDVIGLILVLSGCFAEGLGATLLLQGLNPNQHGPIPVSGQHGTPINQPLSP